MDTGTIFSIAWLVGLGATNAFLTWRRWGHKEWAYAPITEDDPHQADLVTWDDEFERQTGKHICLHTGQLERCKQTIVRGSFSTYLAPGIMWDIYCRELYVSESWEDPTTGMTAEEYKAWRTKSPAQDPSKLIS